MMDSKQAAIIAGFLFFVLVLFIFLYVARDRLFSLLPGLPPLPSISLSLPSGLLDRQLIPSRFSRRTATTTADVIYGDKATGSAAVFFKGRRDPLPAGVTSGDISHYA